MKEYDIRREIKEELYEMVDDLLSLKQKAIDENALNEEELLALDEADSYLYDLAVSLRYPKNSIED
jgi:uncharacterized protein YgfB (UPF0149 family)